jgi:hypothetical protein
MTAPRSPFAQFDEGLVQRLLRHSWSSHTSSLWSVDIPSRGQCAVTALVVNAYFGGEILKTRAGPSWHFYNRVEGRRFDFTSEQFPNLLEYLDLVSSREEALADVAEEQYREMDRRFLEAAEMRTSARAAPRPPS